MESHPSRNEGRAPRPFRIRPSTHKLIRCILSNDSSILRASKRKQIFICAVGSNKS